MTKHEGLRAVHARIEVGAQTYQVETCVEPAGEGFHGFCRDVPGIHVWGDDAVEAFSSCKEAATAYIKAALAKGDPLPVGIVESANLTKPTTRRKPATRRNAMPGRQRALA